MSESFSRRTFLAGALVVPSAALFGCGGGTASSNTNSQGTGTRNAVRQWNDMAMAGVKAEHPGPPMVARAHAMVSTAVFDAWAAYDATAVGTQFKGTLRRPPAERNLANKQKALSFAAYRTLVDLFPTQKALFDTQMATLGYDSTDVSTNTAAPSGIGNRVAAALLTFRHGDGSNQLGDAPGGTPGVRYSDYTGYVPLNDSDTINNPNHWQPLRVPDGKGGIATQKYVGAHWGRVTPFALLSGSQFRTGVALPQFGSPEYLAQAQQIIDISANLTDMQKLLTEYWGDGPGTVQPPGHWIGFADFVSQRDAHDLDTDVKMFFMVANAVMDAGIACWDTKRVYDSARPGTAIHYAFKGQTIRAWGGPGVGTVSVLGENFGTYQSATFITPSFPEYLSGHSTFSAAAAEVLKRFTGSDNFGLTVNFAKGSSTLEPGLVPAQATSQTFATFSDAVASAGFSRLTGGIHFMQGNLDAQAMGRLVGPVVFDKAQTYINGTA